jgi:hypothetical protein
MSDEMDDLPLEEPDDEVVAVLRDPALWDSPSAELADRVVRDIASEAELGPSASARHGRSGMRYGLLGAAAAVLAILIGIVGISAIDQSGDRTVSAALIPTGRAGDSGGSLDLRASDAGVGIEVDAPDLPPCADGDYYEGWVTTSDGVTVPAGTFRAGGTIELWAGVDLDDVTGFTVAYRYGDRADDGGSSASDDVVLKATIDAG